MRGSVRAATGGQETYRWGRGPSAEPRGSLGTGRGVEKCQGGLEVGESGGPLEKKPGQSSEFEVSDSLCVGQSPVRNGLARCAAVSLRGPVLLILPRSLATKCV